MGHSLKDLRERLKEDDTSNGGGGLERKKWSRSVSATSAGLEAP